MIFRSSLALRTLAIGSGPSIDISSYGSGPDKADGANRGVVEQRIHDRLAAIEKIYDTFRNAALIQKFKRPAHGERYALRGLHNERVAGRDGIRQKPEWNHSGKIERRNGRDHAERLTDHGFINAACDVFKVIALHHRGDAAGDFDILDGPAKFGFSLGESLAVFLRDSAPEIVNVFFQ